MSTKNLPQRKNPRLKGFDYSNPYAYFITTNSLHRESYFTQPNLNQEIIGCLLEEKARLQFLIYAYCLMPDHIHLLLSPPGSSASVSDFVGGFKSKTTRISWKYGIKGKLWQGRFHDYIIRKKDDPIRIAEYILNNPVKAGLAEKWEHYPFCGIIDKYW